MKETAWWHIDEDLFYAFATKSGASDSLFKSSMTLFAVATSLVLTSLIFWTLKLYINNNNTVKIDN